MEFSEAFSPVRAIQHGIEGLKRQPVGVLLGGFLMLLVSGGGGSGGGGSPPSGGEGDPEVAAAFALMALFVAGISLCLGIVFWLVRSLLHTGWIRLHRDLVVDGAAEVPQLFSGKDRFRDMALWKLLKGVIGFGVMIVALIPGGALAGLAAAEVLPMAALWAGVGLMILIAVPVGIYVGLGLSLGEFAVALEGAAPMQALERSWELARDNRLTLLWFFVVTGFFTALGFLACCVGIFVTFPIVQVGTTEAYLLATREDRDRFAFMRLDRGELA